MLSEKQINLFEMNESSNSTANFKIGPGEVVFETKVALLNYLKEIGLVSKNKTETILNNFCYKKIVDIGNVLKYNCNVLGYFRKKTNPECLAEKYENLIIESNGEKFNINIDYFKAMQNNKFGMEKESEIY